MWNLALSIAAGLVVSVGIRLTGFNWWACLIPGTLAFIGGYVLLARRTMKMLQTLSAQAQQELSSMPQNQREQKAKLDKAIKLLEQGFPLARWQFLVHSELHGQIGMIKYLAKDLDGALESFKQAGSRNYYVKAMEGALYYQRKNFTDMEKAFEAAVKAGRKEGIVWAVYAWCLFQQKEKDKALKVLARAVEANPSDEKLKGQLTAVQNDKKIKMKPFEPMWWQFGLETPPMMVQGGGRQVRFQRR